MYVLVHLQLSYAIPTVSALKQQLLLLTATVAVIIVIVVVAYKLFHSPLLLNSAFKCPTAELFAETAQICIAELAVGNCCLLFVFDSLLHPLSSCFPYCYTFMHYSALEVINFK